MNKVDFLKWVVFIMLLIGWAVMYAYKILPDGWAQFTLAVGAILYGLPPIVKAGRAVMGRISFK